MWRELDVGEGANDTLRFGDLPGGAGADQTLTESADAMARSLRRLHCFLDDRGTVAQLIREARDRGGLLEEVRAVLPEDAAVRCMAAVLDHGHLRLTVDSPVWASRVRYMGREIGRRLGARGTAVDRVTVQAEPPRSAAPGYPAQTPSLSQAAAACLGALAEGTEDAELRAALERLARHGTESGRG